MLFVLVVAHEFGHFLLAKLSRVKVEEFAFGFPPRLFSFQKGETRYSFNLVPIGGFVKIEGEEGDKAEDPRSFTAQAFWRKILIIIAGVLFNLILAYFLISAGFILGTPVPLGDMDQNPTAEVRLVEIQKGSPAEIAGLQTGDTLIQMANGNTTLEAKNIQEIQNFIQQNKGKAIQIKLKRGGEIVAIEATVRAQVKTGEGALGIVMSRIGIQRLGVFESLGKGFSTTANLTYLTGRALLGFFTEIFRGQSSFESVSGPVGIVGLVGDFSRFGFIFLIQLTALLSINLALINLIPFPGLDGGRILFLAIEKIKGRPFHWKVSQAVNAAGLALLIGLMILVTYHDILKLKS